MSGSASGGRVADWSWESGGDLPYQLLGLTDAQGAFLHETERQVLCRMVVQAGQRARVTLGDAAILDRVLISGETWSSRSVLVMAGAGSPDAACDILLGESELIHELLEGARLIHRVEVRALEVLHQRESELLLLVRRAHDRGDGLQARELRGARAAFAGDQLIAAGHLRDHDGLDDAVLRDALGQGAQLFDLEAAARLIRVALDVRDRDLLGSRGGGRRRGSDRRDRRSGDQGGESAAQASALLRFDVHQRVTHAGESPDAAVVLRRPSRASSSWARSLYACAPREVGL